MRFKKITLVALISLLLISLISLGSWFYFLYNPLLRTHEDLIYRVAPGTTLYKLSYELHHKGLLRNPKYFIWLGQFKHQINIKAGEYRFAAGSKPSEILEQLFKGKVIEYVIVFIEGWTFHDVRHAIAENTKLDHQLTYLDDDELMIKLGKPGQHPEGLFFPATYYFKAGTSDIDLLKRSYAVMQQKLLKAWETRAPNLPYKNPMEALIVASLVEKESAVADERSLIAGIILQRLQKHMLLQIDPTVIYGLGDNYINHLTKVNLKVDSPFNTYRYHGLPPTPIALPSEQSIHAALNPQFSEYLYFVAKGDGTHYFSKTLKEQSEAIKKYLRK